MTYQEEKQVRIRRQSSKQAIGLAMQGRWREAIAVNKSLLENFPNDVDAYNRLGKAYMELGEYAQAEEAYNRALELDHYNVIAKKNLQRLSHFGEVVISPEGVIHKVEPQHFIEEIGKARVLNLQSLATSEVLSRMAPGDKVFLKIGDANLIVENGRGEYLGQVVQKYGQRVIKLMEGGNQYSAAVVSAAGDTISVIIKEVYQHPSQVGLLSFPGRRFEGLQPYVSERVFRRDEYEEELGDMPEHHVEPGLSHEESSETVEDEPDTEE